MSGRLKVGDPRITKERCNQFYADRSINPLTGRRINYEGPTYNIYVKTCSNLIGSSSGANTINQPK